MSNPYQLVVFDWEGTIADTLGFILHTVLAEADTLGFGKVDLHEARQYVNLGLVQTLKNLFPTLSAAQQEQLLNAVYQTMISRPVEVFLIPGVERFIQRLQEKKIEIAIASNRGQASLRQAIQASGLDHYFQVTRSAGQTPPKPCPQMLEEVMQEFGKDASVTLMIGDSRSDMEMAKSIHVTAVGVDFYHQQETDLKAAGALAVFDDYSLLANFLGLSI